MLFKTYIISSLKIFEPVSMNLSFDIMEYEDCIDNVGKFVDVLEFGVVDIISNMLYIFSTLSIKLSRVRSTLDNI